MFNEFLHFPASLTDKPNHYHIGTGLAGDHTEQHTFTDTTTGKQANPLTFA